MPSKKDFLDEKLGNMITWLIKEKILPKTHVLIKKLVMFKSNNDSFIDFLLVINNLANEDCIIPTDKMTLFLSAYELDMGKFEMETVIKFNRYIECFIKALRN